MEPTITQNGTLFAVQHRPAKSDHRPSYEARITNAGNPTPTLQTSVGEFAFRQTALGCHLEILVDNVRWPLGLYGTNDAAVRALKKGRTGFRTWDALKRKTAALKSVRRAAGTQAILRRPNVIQLHWILDLSRYQRSMMPCLRSIG